MAPLLKHSHHHDDDQDSADGDPTLAKTVAMCTLFSLSLIIGIIPIKLNKWFRWNEDTNNNVYVQLLLCVGGGVLLCTTFLHLLPEVSENIEELNIDTDLEINLAELLMCIGFFTMYFVEECVHVYLHKKEKSTTSITRKSIAAISELSNSYIIEKKPNLLEKTECDTASEHHHHDAHHHSEDHHDHSHVILDNDNSSMIAVIRGLLIVLALSIHELFEGLAVGLESSSSNVWYMFGAVSAHKLVIAFCIGVELVTSNLRTLLVVAYVFTFAIVSPMGIGIGIAVTSSNASTTLVSVMLQGLASGTLLYVVFFEILKPERKGGIKQYFAVLLGFVLMFGLTLME